MSKISFTLSVPHEGSHMPQFSVSCNNATYLSFKGKDIGSARFGNGNLTPKKGWKRLEFGVTGSRAATRFSVMVNTSAILPPIAWSSPGPAPAASAARGGSTPTAKDLKLGAKMLKEREEGGGRRLRIENGDQEWNERHNRTYDEKRGRSRADRGERVRRSERRHGKNIEVVEDLYLTEEEEEELPERKEHHEGRRERVRRKDRRRSSHNGDAQEEEWEEESKQRVRRRDRERSLEQEHRGRIQSRKDVEGRKKVAGKKIGSKYGRSGRESDTSSQQDSGYAEDVDRLPRERYERRAKPQYRRSQRRQEPLRPVDFGYEPDIIGD